LLGVERPPSDRLQRGAGEGQRIGQQVPRDGNRGRASEVAHPAVVARQLPCTRGHWPVLAMVARVRVGVRRMAHSLAGGRAGSVCAEGHGHGGDPLEG